MIDIHHVHGPTVIAGCSELIIADGVPIAVCFGRSASVVAPRIVELLDEHGLVTIPDTIEGATGCPWPPPDGPPAGGPT